MLSQLLISFSFSLLWVHPLPWHCKHILGAFAAALGCCLFTILLSSWTPRPERVGSRPTECFASAGLWNSVPCTIRYVIALWWLWLMMLSTNPHSGEKHTPLRSDGLHTNDCSKNTTATNNSRKWGLQIFTRRHISLSLSFTLSLTCILESNGDTTFTIYFFKATVM